MFRSRAIPCSPTTTCLADSENHVPNRAGSSVRRRRVAVLPHERRSSRTGSGEYCKHDLVVGVSTFDRKDESRARSPRNDWLPSCMFGMTRSKPQRTPAEGTTTGSRAPSPPSLSLLTPRRSSGPELADLRLHREEAHDDVAAVRPAKIFGYSRTLRRLTSYWPAKRRQRAPCRRCPRRGSFVS